ncbi:hypothetical protein NPIL_337911 [Nephila pilipes]|uniref:Uncharacterized protein n=1 Tax=Nephila pilipes TaxID=299642 RepID=A0A8X6PYG2_NEPPI|nr:hypothetical protein NPIL_337911 [Nephila pilipes]
MKVQTLWNFLIILMFVRYPFEVQIELLKSLKLQSYRQMRTEKLILNGGSVIAETAMVRKINGALSLIKQVAGNATSSHNVIHQHFLVTRRLLKYLKLVSDDAIHRIYHVKSHLLHLLKINAEYLDSPLNAFKSTVAIKGNILRTV